MMSSIPAITLYDISSGLTPQAWSPNTWKARMVLNYKGIPYKTEWITYPDIEATVKKLGCSHTKMKGDKPIYTLPVIVDNSNSTPVAVTDSLEIAKYLDAKFPDRPVFPEKGIALQYVFEVCLRDLAGQNFAMVMMPLTWAILDERGKAYFRETREQWSGKTIEEMSAERHGYWESIEEAFDRLAKILDQNGPGVDFVAGGSEPTWADIVLVSYLAFIKVIAPEEGWNTRLRNSNGGRWQRLWDKSVEWRAIH